MKRLCFSFTFLVLSFPLFAQKYEDNLITVTVNDTTKLYERVRQAITFTDLIIREDSKRDTLITYPEKMYYKTIFVITKVIISGNQVKISGAFGLGPIDFWGHSAWPKSYNEIVYYKGNESWQLLRHIVIKLDGKIDYSRILD